MNGVLTVMSQLSSRRAMIRHDPTWLCPRHTRLYINYLGKVYGKNALDFHFWKPSDVTTAQLYKQSITSNHLVDCKTKVL